MMKKTILTLISAIACLAGANAEEKTAISVWVNDADAQTYNISSQPVIKHTDGKLQLKVNGGTLGSYEIYNGMKITFTKESQLGDVNADSTITMADANSIVNKYLNGEAANINVTAADYNKDGQITMADANSVVNAYLTEQ
ncbi:MAG: hypothetical protein II844_00825 [Prevotella sp.]|nr:hypothetical protein [Prevotella sp.]